MNQPIMLLNNSLHHRQAEPNPLSYLLGRKEWIEYLVQVGWHDAASSVPNPKHYVRAGCHIGESILALITARIVQVHLDFATMIANGLAPREHSCTD